MTLRIWLTLAIAAAVFAADMALAVPAGAQGFDDRFNDQRSRRQYQPQQRDFFPFPFFGGDRGSPAPAVGIPFIRPPQPVIDASKAPPPRKADVPPTTTILVIGDSFADWLGYGLEEALTDTLEMGVVRRIKAASGLTHYESAHGDTLDWSQAIKETLAAEKPNAIVVMLGLNDRQPLRERAPTHPAQPPQAAQPAAAPGDQKPAAGQPGAQAAQNQPAGHDEAPPAPAKADAGQQTPPAAAAAAAADTQRAVPGASYDFHTDKWGELYGKRIDEMIAALRTKGVPVLWVGLPAIRGPRATSDMSYLDELYRARAEKAGISYVDVWGGFVDDGGRFTVEGPDFEGQIRRLRAGDGIHFTKAGAVKLAGYVTQELRRVISTHIAPVALPGPEEPAGKPGAAGLRSAVGPVVPLSMTGGGEGGDLLGAGRPSQAPSDPVATRVLTRGDAVAPAPGRADDFSWPHADGSSSAAPIAEPAPLAPAVPAGAQAAKAPAGKGETNKSDTSRSEVKKPADAKSQQPQPDAATTRPRRARADLDGAAPRPPLPVGGGNSLTR